MATRGTFVSGHVTASGHPVDYDWWKTHSRDGDHCIRGTLSGPDVAVAAAAVLGTLRGFEQYPGVVDGEPITAAVDGGLRAYAAPAHTAADPDLTGGVVVYLHSTGEDATDVLCEASRHLAAIVRRCPGEGALRWEQLPADRTDHQFSFDGRRDRRWRPRRPTPQ